LNPELLSPELHALLRSIATVAPGSFLVGGALRDLLRGIAPVDLDIIVPGDAGASTRLLADVLGGSAFPLDEERQQFRIALREPLGGIRQVDVSPIDGDLEADMRSRDYTINAMAASIDADGELGELVDPTGGLGDLETRTLRLVSVENLRDDPLRLLRGARIATELDLEVEEGTAGVIAALASLLPASAAERQRDELLRLLATPRSAKGILLMDRLGLLRQVLPELDPAHGVEQPGEHHYYDVFDHSVECLAVLDALANEEPVEDGTGILGMRDVFDEALEWYPVRAYLDERVQSQPRWLLLKLAGLLHDVSKPETKSVEPSGKIRFLGHPEKGATKTEALCRRLRFGNNEAAFVALLVEEHLRPTMLAKPGEPPSRRALFRFFRDLGEAGPAVLFLMLADGAAAAGPRLTRQGWVRRVSYVSYLLERYDEISRVEEQTPRLVNGHDIIEGLDLAPGPLVGRLMRDVDEAIGAGEVTTREDAIEYARTLLGGIASGAAAEEKQDG
jgi:poly(A) polymerase